MVTSYCLYHSFMCYLMKPQTIWVHQNKSKLVEQKDFICTVKLLLLYWNCMFVLNNHCCFINILYNIKTFLCGFNCILIDRFNIDQTKVKSLLLLSKVFLILIQSLVFFSLMLTVAFSTKILIKFFV